MRRADSLGGFPELVEAAAARPLAEAGARRAFAAGATRDVRLAALLASLDRGA